MKKILILSCFIVPLSNATYASVGEMTRVIFGETPRSLGMSEWGLGCHFVEEGCDDWWEIEPDVILIESYGAWKINEACKFKTSLASGIYSGLMYGVLAYSPDVERQLGIGAGWSLLYNGTLTQAPIFEVGYEFLHGFQLNAKKIFWANKTGVSVGIGYNLAKLF